MKISFKIFPLLLGVALLSRCPDEQEIQLQEQFEDITTSANAYADQFLTFNITTIPGDQHFDFDKPSPSM